MSETVRQIEASIALNRIERDSTWLNDDDNNYALRSLPSGARRARNEFVSPSQFLKRDGDHL